MRLYTSDCLLIILGACGYLLIIGMCVCLYSWLGTRHEHFTTSASTLLIISTSCMTFRSRFSAEIVHWSCTPFLPPGWLLIMQDEAIVSALPLPISCVGAMRVGRGNFGQPQEWLHHSKPLISNSL